MSKPEGFHSYVVKVVLVNPSDDPRPVRAALLAVVASGVETAINSVREMTFFQNMQEWRIEYVREGVIT